MIHISRFTTFAITAISMVSILQSCNSSEGKSNEKTEAVATPPIEAIKLQKNSLSSSIKMPGELVAYQQVDLYAKVSSFIKKMYVDVGSEVQAGQLLAVMEAPEVNAQLSAATARVKSLEALYLSSKATYDRLLQTSKTPGTVSQNDLDVANARQKSDLAQFEAAKASRNEVSETNNYLQIRAPFSGIITARNVSAGAYVGPSGKGSELPIFTLQEQKKLRLVISVPDAYVSNMNSQSEVEFTVKSMPNEKFKAKVTRMAGALDNRLRSQHTEMDVINNDKRLLPGMIAEVSITLSGNKKAYVVPSSAVLNSTEGTFVIKVQDNKSHWEPVKTGKTDDDKTEVFGELHENDVIIKSATEEIRKDAPIKNVSIK